MGDSGAARGDAGCDDVTGAGVVWATAPGAGVMVSHTMIAEASMHSPTNDLSTDFFI